MAIVSHLLWIPNYRSAPITILRTFTTHRHKTTVFTSSIWDSDFNFLHKNSSRTFASDSAVSVAVASTLSTHSYSEYGRLLPCPTENYQPRIEHLVVKEDGPILDFITKSLDLPPLYVADLIDFGAVFYALVCPTPPSTATQEEMKLYKEVTDPSVLKKRSSIKGITVREAQKTFRITRVDHFVESGTYVRVHVHPKRFPRCYEIDWRSRIIGVTESFVVLNKPAGTSVGGTTDNIKETCANFATRALELTTPLMTTHQIDNCTEGCVVLARTKDYCSVFHKNIREKQVKKLYLALAASYVPCGLMTHYMRPFRMAPKIVSEDTSSTSSTPIVGDSMYMPAVIAELASPGVNPFGRYNKKQFENEVDREIAAEEWATKHGKEPSVAVGLPNFMG